MDDFIADNHRIAFALAIVFSGLLGGTLLTIAWWSRRHPVRALVAAAVGVAFLVTGARLASTYRMNRYIYELQDRTGINVSSYSFWTLHDGVQHRLDEFGGKPVLLYLWASYCGSCRPSLPVLAQLAVALQGRATVILLSTEDRESLLGFAEQHEIPGIAAYALEPEVPPGRSWVFPQAPLPTLFLIDEEGIVRRIRVGWRAGGYLRKLATDPRSL